MNRILLAMLVLLASVVDSGAQQEKLSDLESYIESIRAARITEVGRGEIVSIACICAGATILDYRKDESSGRYWPSYASATCPKPDADPPQIQQWKKLRLSDSDMLSDKLKPFADTDGSGFVTTREASDFRALVEFGYLVSQVNRDEGTSAALIARASGYDAAEVARKVEQYAALARKIDEAGVTVLPQVKLTAD